MSERERRMQVQFERLSAMAPMGYGAGIHIRFASPLRYHSTFPAAWRELYDSQNLQLRDPLLFWGMSQTGATRWSAVTLPDPFGVLRLAADHGLRFGVTVSTGKITSRTIVGIARSDREYDDAEVAAAEAATLDLHQAAQPPRDLGRPEADVLRLLAEGQRVPAVAAELGVDEDEVRRRIGEARAHLGAASTAEAIRLARDNRLM
jgi:LuxR family transcriptional regulator